VEEISRNVKICIRLKDVSAELKAGKEVPGADLLINRVSVRLD
jgi:hypothetical protein